MQDKNNQGLSILLFIAGILLIGTGAIFLFQDPGFSGEFLYFGGDAYTELQHAIVDAVRNTQTTNVLLKCGFGIFFLFSGFLTGVKGLINTLSVSRSYQPGVSTPKPAETPAAAETNETNETNH